ncbi:xanthine phosphoribosyltransferase [Kushneria phosphatilytica]|uniref:Xanthine-guanine phosphoribosyltransferase n=1 Tax=Kushneria phosphatilytica TaxID=657387 RepID=A0A1S1NVT2_9GAMM|nr:xanthine phosphoribosyltransferase [Kushneria phosphatilytica]OHV12071.1 xanthine phosphoribosyltransferase [Kushneria phosphatilytica]QEL11262.1 xanthine phosphoribosyltransferase [Kushneria phosphatilytica]
MSVDRYHQYFVISWDQLHRDVRSLCQQLVERDFEGIAAVTRGGLIPAALIARELDVRLIDTVCIKSYEHMEQGGLQVLKGIDHDGARWLLVDDLVDTGRTARAVRDMLPQAHFVTVYAKPEGRPLVDQYLVEVPQDTWIQFPWDMGVTYVEPLVDQLRSQQE